MAIKKAKPVAARAAKVVAATATTATGARAVALESRGTDNSQRLLREAAWSRMFGRTQTKNPFAR